jgi:hypothetical protein
MLGQSCPLHTVLAAVSLGVFVQIVDHEKAAVPLPGPYGVQRGLAGHCPLVRRSVTAVGDAAVLRGG